MKVNPQLWLVERNTSLWLQGHVYAWSLVWDRVVGDGAQWVKELINSIVSQPIYKGGREAGVRRRCTWVFFSARVQEGCVICILKASQMKVAKSLAPATCSQTRVLRCFKTGERPRSRACQPILPVHTNTALWVVIVSLDNGGRVFQDVLKGSVVCRIKGCTEIYESDKKMLILLWTSQHWA